MDRDKMKKRKNRKAQEATVTGSEWISPEMIRLFFNAPSLVGKELEHTDHYIKMLFVPEGADYGWPFDMAAIRETVPRELQPVTRTYTLRTYDTTTGDFSVDFVVHGDEGLAGPWAPTAQVGEKIGFMGPGGGWHPEPEYEHFVLAGDEAAAPAVAAAIEALPKGATADVFLEVSSPETEFEVELGDGVNLTWVHRDDAVHGTKLSEIVRAHGVPAKKTGWFIHGVAEMIKELRRFLFVDNQVDRADVSISGYWRLGMIEDQWQASKREFVAEMEREENQ